MLKSAPTIERKPVAELGPAPYNPRTISPEALDGLLASVERFGLVEPIVWNQRTGNVVGGHQRLKVLQRLGETETQVVVVDLPETEEKALNIALNNPAIAGDFTPDVHILLAEIKDVFPELSDGLLLDDLASETSKLLAELAPIAGLSDPDLVPPAPESPTTKEGDLWVLGDHRLLCGDATQQEAVSRLMAANTAEMVFTDPPFNIDYASLRDGQRPIANDNLSSRDFQTFCQRWVEQINAHCEGCVYVCGAPGPDGRRMFQILDDTFCWSSTIIWNKNRFTLGRGKYQNKYEPIWFGWHKTGKRFSRDRSLANVWDFDRPNCSDLHPTMKPVALIEHALSHASRLGDIVMDLFGGSGSTLLACERTGRRARLMEVDPGYCDIIVRRWEDHTGRTGEVA